MSDANGGYYTDSKTVIPLRTGAASFVVYKNGSATVAQWGRDVTMGPDVVSVRQNLDLLVDNGQVVPAVYSSDPTQWGTTLGGGLYVWRSGLGVTATAPWSTSVARARHRRPGDHSRASRCRAGDGARYQHRLGELQHLPPVDARADRRPPPTVPSCWPE